MVANLSCPVDGCDYSGGIESVKSHITAKMDSAHAGKKGDDVVAEAEGADESGAEQAEEPAQDNTDEEVGDGGADDEGADSGAGEAEDSSMVWVIGAGLVGLYLILTGQREQGQSGGPDVL
jgi:hypothetical protein